MSAIHPSNARSSWLSDGMNFIGSFLETPTVKTVSNRANNILFFTGCYYFAKTSCYVAQHGWNQLRQGNTCQKRAWGVLQAGIGVIGITVLLGLAALHASRYFQNEQSGDSLREAECQAQQDRIAKSFEFNGICDVKELRSHKENCGPMILAKMNPMCIDGSEEGAVAIVCSALRIHKIFLPRYHGFIEKFQSLKSLEELEKWIRTIGFQVPCN